MKSCFTFVLILIGFKSSYGFPADQIQELPGLNKSDYNFKQYSGYLDVGNGKHYHYWFVESQSNPAKDPVILWLNGGPGASSLIGFWTENGPFRLESDGKTLVKHPNSWNTIANVLYLESPAGVGYSYNTNINRTTYNDDMVAQENYLALEHFFIKFPQFSNNSFYLTGESYGGIYIPTLTLEIYRRKSKINLKGVAIGNGALDLQMIFTSMIHNLYYHGLIDSIKYKKLTKNCCKCTEKGQVCNFANNKEHSCNVQSLLRDQVENDGMNSYNIYLDCHRTGHSAYNQFYTNIMNMNFESELNQINDNHNLSTNAFCFRDEYENYMNRKDVRKALHIPDYLPKWSFQDIMFAYDFKIQSMKTQVKEIIEKYKIPTFIVYNGDVDIVVDVMAAQQFVDDLGYKLNDRYKKWTVGGRTAGFVKRYEGITFMTVRNAGHMVPSDQPEAALAIIKELIGLSKVA